MPTFYKIIKVRLPRLIALGSSRKMRTIVPGSSTNSLDAVAALTRLVVWSNYSNINSSVVFHSFSRWLEAAASPQVCTTPHLQTGCRCLCENAGDICIKPGSSRRVKSYSRSGRVIDKGNASRNAGGWQRPGYRKYQWGGCIGC